MSIMTSSIELGRGEEEVDELDLSDMLVSVVDPVYSCDRRM